MVGGEARDEHAASPVLPFRKLEQLIVRDMELSKDQMALLLDQSDGEPRVELTDSALAHYASKINFISCRPRCASITSARSLKKSILVYQVSTVSRTWAVTIFPIPNRSSSILRHQHAEISFIVSGAEGLRINHMFAPVLDLSRELRWVESKTLERTHF